MRFGEDRKYRIEDRPWAQNNLPSANEIWQKGPESHLIPEDNDKHLTPDDQMVLWKGYADYSSGYVAYKTAPDQKVQ